MQGMRQKLPDLPLQAVLWGLAGAWFFTTQDAAFKWFSEGYAIAQIMFLRSFAAAALAGAWVKLCRHPMPLAMRRPRLFALTLSANIAAWFCFYYGLSRLPLTTTICIFFLTPIVITLLGILLLKEKPSWPQFVALLVGFGGVFVITDPLANSQNLDLGAVIWILISVLLWSLVAVLTRLMTNTMTVQGTLFYTTIGFWVVSALALPLVWQTPTPTMLAGMVLVGFISAGAQVCMWTAYRTAKATLVALTEYSAIIFAAIYGWYLWDEQQGARDFVGIGLIVLAGVFAMFSKRPV